MLSRHPSRRAQVPSLRLVAFIRSSALLAAFRFSEPQIRPRDPDQTNEFEAESNTPSIDPSKLALLIATGELPFPTSLSSHETDRLAVQVRNRRRTQLVQFLARQVAQHLHARPPDLH